MRILALLFALITSFTLCAQKTLRTPLSAVPADSVGLWDMGTTNWRIATKQFHQQVVAQPFKVQQKQYRALRKNMSQGSFTLTGGQQPLFNAEEPYQAAQALTNAVQLFLLTGESSSLDLAERALFNALPYALHRPDLSLFDKGTAAQALINGIGAIYATLERSIYVNFYLNSFVRLQIDTLRLTIDQITNMPYLPGSKFRIGGLPKGLHHFTLRLRLPEWANAHETTLSVNGHDEELQIEQGYITINRQWRNGDEATIHLPYTPRLLLSKSGEKFIALGSLLFVPRESKKCPTTPFPTIDALEMIEDELTTICLKAGDWEFIPLQESTEKLSL